MTTTTPRTCELEGCNVSLEGKRSDARYCSRAHYEKARNSMPERREAQSRPARRQRAAAKAASKREPVKLASMFRQFRRIKARLEAKQLEERAREAAEAEATGVPTHRPFPKLDHRAPDYWQRLRELFAGIDEEELEELEQGVWDFMRQGGADPWA